VWWRWRETPSREGMERGLSGAGPAGPRRMRARREEERKERPGLLPTCACLSVCGVRILQPWPTTYGGHGAQGGTGAGEARERTRQNLV